MFNLNKINMKKSKIFLGVAVLLTALGTSFAGTRFTTVTGYRQLASPFRTIEPIECQARKDCSTSGAVTCKTVIVQQTVTLFGDNLGTCNLAVFELP